MIETTKKQGGNEDSETRKTVLQIAHLLVRSGSSWSYRASARFLP